MGVVAVGDGGDGDGVVVMVVRVVAGGWWG